MQKEIEYLGYQLTSNGLECQPKKIEAMERILPPKNVKQLKRWIGMINFYRDCFEKRSQILAPLTELAAECGKRKGTKAKSAQKWEKRHQIAFDESKRMLKERAALAFPDFSKPFSLYSDASDVQLGATLVQGSSVLGFYTRKLNSAQMNYTVGEKELLGIVEGVKAFEGVIRGFDLTIHTDHLNLLYNKLPNQRMARWRLLLEEFSPKVVHVKGELNTAADCLSRNEMKHMDFDLIEWEPPPKQLRYCDFDDKKNIDSLHGKDIAMVMTQVMSRCDFEADAFDDVLYPISSRAQVAAELKFPLSMQRLKEDQMNNTEFIAVVNRVQRSGGKRFTHKKVENVNLVHDKGKIYVPKAARHRILDWYHNILVHPGKDRMYKTMKAVFTWDGI